MVYQKSVKIPEGVKASLEGAALSVKGKKGELKKEFRHPRAVLKIDGGEIKISANSESRKDWAVVGTWSALVQNMVAGVENGYTYTLKLIYTHFPITVKVAGEEVQMHNYLGEKLPRTCKITSGCKVDVKKEIITVSGIDKYAVGQTAASIEKLGMNKRNKDTRVFQDGAYIIEAKVG